ncbi:polysaccharide biosynthesis/export family protein [candidate division KSB1 bacterium]|nr:polysaccharide biosynthesis/export family protein [candidate division KSB1 bacterium]
MKKLASRAGVLLPVVLIHCIGCSSHTQLNRQQSFYGEMQLPRNDSITKSDPVYTFGIDDLIEIKFFDNDQFNETVRVRPDGRISLAKVDEIFVLGMTPMQLDSFITAAYAKIIQRPDVTVIVREFGARQIFVLGEVNSPGGYAVHRNMTLLHGIAAAGGLKVSAEPRSIMILRRKNSNILAAYKIDVTRSYKLAESYAKSSDPFIYSMDIIYVPKTYIASASAFLNQIYDIILPPLDTYLRAMWYTAWAR